MSAALVLQRGPLTQQPQYAAPIDRGNPLALGLSGAFTPALGNATPVNGASLLASRDGIGYSTSSTSAQWIASNTALVSASPTWTILAVLAGTSTNTATGGVPFYVERPNGMQIVKLEMGDGGTNTAALVVRDTSGNLIVQRGNTDIRADAGKRRVIVGTRRAANDHRIYVNGALDGAATGTVGGSFGASNAIIGCDPQDGSNGSLSGASLPLVLVWNRALSDAEIASVSANPWQLFQAPRRRLWLAVNNTATGAALSGAASAVASATGSLTTSIPLAASAAVVASASAALSTQIALTASAAAQAAASASLSTQIRLTGSASAAASASASLSTQIALSGSAAAAATASATLATGSSVSGAAVASASASASLTTGIALTGSATGAASASGALSTGIALTGAASAQASASATLTAGSGMGGSASAQASASATLATAISLAGAAIAQAQASASLSGQAAALAGSASASASASAQITTGISLSGAAQAAASGQAALSTQIALVAIAQAQASAWAQFAPTHAPTMRIYGVPAQSRSVAVNAESRLYAVDAQTRTNTT